MLSCGYQLSFGKSLHYEAVLCTLDHKQSELDTGHGSYAIVLVVAPLVSLTIAKFISLSEHCFVAAIVYTVFKYLDIIPCK